MLKWRPRMRIGFWRTGWSGLILIITNKTIAATFPLNYGVLTAVCGDGTCIPKATISTSKCLFLNTWFLHRSVTHLNLPQTPTILLFNLAEWVDSWSYLMEVPHGFFSGWPLKDRYSSEATPSSPHLMLWVRIHGPAYLLHSYMLHTLIFRRIFGTLLELCVILSRLPPRPTPNTTE